MLTGKLAACSMGRGSSSPVGYQFLTCPPSLKAPCTSAHHKFKCTNSHPLPSSPTLTSTSSSLYFCLCFNPATYQPAFSLKLKNCHCFTVTFIQCFVQADHLGLFYDEQVSHVLFGDRLCPRIYKVKGKAIKGMTKK